MEHPTKKETAMKITFLGCSHGVPEIDRFCSCTMIEVGGKIYFIDAGAPMVDLIKRYGKKVEDVKAVFTTHAHGDHIGGIGTFADLLNWYFKDASVDLYMTEEKPVKAIIDYVEAIQNAPFDRERIRFNIIDEGFVYEDENIKVTAFPTQHLKKNDGRRPSFGYLVEADGKRVVFSGDLSIHLREQDFPKIALEEEVDLVICEMAHFGVDKVSPFLDRCKTKELWFNHVGYFSTFEEIEALNGKFKFNIKLAHDGDEIVL